MMTTSTKPIRIINIYIIIYHHSIIYPHWDTDNFRFRNSIMINNHRLNPSSFTKRSCLSRHLYPLVYLNLQDFPTFECNSQPVSCHSFPWIGSLKPQYSWFPIYNSMISPSSLNGRYVMIYAIKSMHYLDSTSHHKFIYLYYIYMIYIYI